MKPFAERSGFSRNTVAFSYFVIYNVLVKELSQSEINMKEVLILANEIMVSVICNAYNHERYIRDALDGFLMQKTNFAFEVLIHDDASTDKTADIIREYEANYPDIIKPIYQTENQYSKDPATVHTLQYSRVRGKYIALCEGDDYWTHPLKLQRQVDAMENHPDVDMCAHCAFRINAETKEVIDYIQPSKKNTILTIQQVIMGTGGYVATNSLLFRSNFSYNRPKFATYLPIDYSLQISGALRGGMIYLSDCMSAYRWMSTGSWTAKLTAKKSHVIQHYKQISIMLCMLDAETDYRYTNTIHKRIILDIVGLHREDNSLNTLLTKEYHELFQDLPLATKIEVIIRVYFPGITAIAQSIYRRIILRHEE